MPRRPSPSTSSAAAERGERGPAATVADEARDDRPDQDVRGIAGQLIRAPFSTGLFTTFGALAAYTLLQAIAEVRQVLLLVVLSAFVAIGLNPAVSYLHRRGLPRPLAVAAVLVGLVVLVAGAVATFVPALVTELSHLASEAPRLLGDLRQIPVIARLDDRFHLLAQAQRQATDLASRHPEQLVGGLLGLGQALLGLLGSIVTVLALTGYFVAEAPVIAPALGRLVPRSRRARVVLLADEVASLVGGYVLGKLITAVLAGLFQLTILLIFGVPFASALALLTALLSLIPLIGGYASGAVCGLVALTVSAPAALGVVASQLVYRLVEDYLITPRIMRRSVDISPVLTIVSVIVGGAMLGLVGALLAIPAAAGGQLIGREVLVRRLDRS